MKRLSHFKKKLFCVWTIGCYTNNQRVSCARLKTKPLKTVPMAEGRYLLVNKKENYYFSQQMKK